MQREYATFMSEPPNLNMYEWRASQSKEICKVLERANRIEYARILSELTVLQP